MATIITSAQDAKALKFGDQFTISPAGFDDPDHDPVEFSEAYAKLAEEVQEVVGNLQPPAGVSESIEVEFNDTHVFFTSTIDQQVEVGGDVRDGKVNLTAGKRAQRTLTGEGHGFVSINGERFSP